MEAGNSLPDIGRGYRELRPLLFGALGKLARQGFVTPPADGLDLIHDFFADEWPKIERTYDPAKGNYHAYAYKAFVQFVRPRIVRMQRFQNYNLRPDQAETVLAEAESTNLDLTHDHQLLRAKIAELPQLQREILATYVYSDNVSERSLARYYSLSRYRLRELLVEALGRVLVQLDRPAEIPHTDWQVALALWRDVRSIPKTAKYLGLTEHQVRTANKRNFEFLSKVLSIYHPHRIARRQEMETSDGVLGPRALFKKAILSPNVENLLDLIRERAAEVLASLDEPGDMDISEDELKSLKPEWVATVYDTLARSIGPVELSEHGEDLFYAHADAEFEIGEAFKGSLIPGLPEHLADLAGHWLHRFVEPVEQHEMNSLLTTPAARGADPLSRDLAVYGVTPLTVLDATDAVARLLNRCIRSGRLEEPIFLSHRGINDGQLLRAADLADEISRVAVCRPITAEVLLDWSIEVAQIKPLLFNTFTAEPSRGESVVLIQSGDKHNNLYQRWGLSVPRMAVLQ